MFDKCHIICNKLLCEEYHQLEVIKIVYELKTPTIISQHTFVYTLFPTTSRDTIIDAYLKHDKS